MDRGLLLVKPDGVAAGITDDVLAAVRERGGQPRLVGRFTLDADLVDLWYPEICDEPEYRATVDFLTSGPLQLIEVRAPDAFALTRAVKREWRAASGTERRRGMLHCPDGPMDFAHEWALFAPLASGMGIPSAGPVAYPWRQRVVRS